MGRLDGKVGVVTKAASAIGRGTASCLAKEGAAWGVHLNSQSAEQIVSEIAGQRTRHVSAYRRVQAALRSNHAEPSFKR